MEHNSVLLCYMTSTGFLRVNGLSMDPRILGHHSLVSEHRYAIT